MENAFIHTADVLLVLKEFVTDDVRRFVQGDVSEE